MTHICLVSCASKKLSHPAEARDLYVSSLFAKSRGFSERYCDLWFILSAKYGLVEPTQIIQPYEETLNTKSRRARNEWAELVWASLRPKLKPGDRVTVLAGAKYREALVPRIQEYGSHVDVPMTGLGIGRQLQWLTRQLA